MEIPFIAEHDESLIQLLKEKDNGIIQNQMKIIDLTQ